MLPVTPLPTERFGSVAARALGRSDVFEADEPAEGDTGRFLQLTGGLLDAHVSPTPTSVVHGAEQTTRELQEAAGVALGRLIGFEHI